MTTQEIKKVTKPTVKALKEFNKMVQTKKPTKEEIRTRLHREAKSSVDIEYPREDINGITA